ncbi:MerR family transcriptional regulator [Candidatus Dojkabacteria bacterium]|nr:MerR family transcriptional regulator [Candidatus Dojkabacteria bacterium]
MNFLDQTKPVFTTGMASKLTGINPKTIINYENAGLSDAHRTANNRRLFSKSDLYKILIIKYLLKEKQLTFNSAKFLFGLLEKLDADGIDGLKYILPDKIKSKFIQKIDI